jgi:lipoprotein-releasing system permease protein
LYENLFNLYSRPFTTKKEYMKYSDITLLARAYLFNSSAPTALRIIQRLAFAGILIGTCALMLSLIITRGFEKEIGSKLKGINSDAVMSAPGNTLDYDDIATHLKTTPVAPFIKGMSGSTTRHIIVEHNGDNNVQFLRAINPDDELKVSCLGEKVVAPAGSDFSSLFKTKQGVLIGSRAALSLRLWIGDEITVYIPSQGSGASLALEKKTLTVAGIFQVGIEEYDANIMYCSFDVLRDFFPDAKGVDQIAVSYQRPERYVPQTLRQRLRYLWYQFFDSDDAFCQRQTRKLTSIMSGLCVRSWKDMYPDLVASLKLETIAFAIVLSLIALVASMLMASMLFMLITYKRHDIAILRALGMSSGRIAQLFLLVGMSIVTAAVTCGLALAGLIGWWIQTYKPITLPDVYYVTHLPAVLEWHLFIVVFVVAMLMGLGACLLPLRSLKSFAVAQVLRGN